MQMTCSRRKRVSKEVEGRVSVMKLFRRCALLRGKERLFWGRRTRCLSIFPATEVSTGSFQTRVSSRSICFTFRTRREETCCFMLYHLKLRDRLFQSYINPRHPAMYGAFTAHSVITKAKSSKMLFSSFTFRLPKLHGWGRPPPS